MISVAVSDFRAELPKYLAKLKTGEKIELTSHGKQVALVFPPETKEQATEKKLKELRKTAKIKDVVSPLPFQWKTKI